MLLEIKKERASVLCPACRDTLNNAPVKQCETCHVPSHAECLTEIGCASLNCNAIGVKTPHTDNPLLQWAIEAQQGYVSYVIENNEDDQLGAGSTIRIPWTYYDRDMSEIANRIALDREYGEPTCDCEELDTICDWRYCQSYEDRTACDWLQSRNGHYIVEITTEPCGCGYNDNDPDDLWACEKRAIELLDSMESYPCVCEDIESQYRFAEERRQFIEFGWDDLKKGLKLSDFILEELEDIEAEYDNFTDLILEAYHNVCSELEAYAERCSDSFNWPWENGYKDEAQSFIDAFREEIGIDELECVCCVNDSDLIIQSMPVCEEHEIELKEIIERVKPINPKQSKMFDFDDITIDDLINEVIERENNAS